MIYSRKYIEYDFEFLKEITELIITNLTELNNSLASSVTIKDHELCMRQLYQSKVTLNLIGNDQLLAKAVRLSEMLKAKPISKEDQWLLDSFRLTCHQEIIQLHARLKYYENHLVTASK